MMISRPGTFAIMLKMGMRIMSSFFEKPQTAPRMTPIVMLIAAQMMARAREIRAPAKMLYMMELPDLPEPKSHLKEKPKCFIM